MLQPPGGAPPGGLKDRRNEREQRYLSRRKPCKGYGYAFISLPHASTAPAPGCDELCKTCSRSFLCGLRMADFTYTECPTDDAAQEKLDNLKTRTLANLAEVHAALKEYGNTILKRWQKSSRSERVALLLKAMPDMYQHSGGFLRENKKCRAHDERHRNLYLLPWLNVNALAEEIALLPALMHFRTAYKPSKFAEFDGGQIDYGFKQDKVALEYNPHCVVMHGSRFGRMEHWDAAAFHRADTTSFTRALLTFEAQYVLSRFLVKALSCSMLDSKLWQKSGRVKLDGLMGSNAPTTRSLITDTTFSGSPFSAPPTFDMSAIVESLQGRLRAAEDELWLLQTDAVVAYDHVALMKGSTMEALPKHGTTETPDVKRVRCIMLAVETVENWHYILEEAQLAKKTIDAKHSAVRQGSALPEEYAEALSIFEWVLKEHFAIFIARISRLIGFSGTFNKFVCWREGELYVVGGTHEEHMKDPIYFHLISLFMTNETDYPYPHFFHIQQLEEHLGKNSNKDAARIGHLLWNVIEDISLLGDVLSAVRLHRPYAPIRAAMLTPMDISNIVEGDFRDLRPVDALNWARKRRSVLLCQFMIRNLAQSFVYLTHVIGYEDENAYMLLINPLKDFLRLPCPTGKLNRETLQELHESNLALRNFWQKVKIWRQSKFDAMTCKPEDVARHQDMLFIKSMQSKTDCWPQERESLLAVIEANEQKVIASCEALSRGLAPTTQSTWNREMALPPKTIAVSKTKAKSRSVARNTEGSTWSNKNDKEENEEEFPPVLFTVGKMAAAVFSRMFKPASEQVETKWTDFVAGMTDIGFSIMPGGGSAVSFRRTSTQDTIVFHRPHPSPNISSIVLRKMGKRLTKWFGYGADTFVEIGGE